MARRKAKYIAIANESIGFGFGFGFASKYNIYQGPVFMRRNEERGRETERDKNMGGYHVSQIIITFVEF